MTNLSKHAQGRLLEWILHPLDRDQGRWYGKVMADIAQRKGDHLDLCATDEVEFRARTTLLEGVQLVHQSLPDMAVEEVQLSTELLGKKLQLPLFIAAMTGGTDRAAGINQQLAAVAERLGCGIGLGSQRAMHKRPEAAWTYRVRDWAPTALLLGNVGVVQAREMSKDELMELVEGVGLDALCVHMNPAMELIQDGGDRDFRGGTETFARLVQELPIPVVAKETGSGVSRQTAQRLFEAGVRHVDVSGAGGTSWVGVETLRAEDSQRKLGSALWDWGIPTAASVSWAAEQGLQVIATGGIRSGYDVARSIALGARAAGMARPALQALDQEGERGAERLLRQVAHELRSIMLLCAAKTLSELRRAPRVISGELRHWLREGQPNERLA